MIRTKGNRLKALAGRAAMTCLLAEVRRWCR